MDEKTRLLTVAQFAQAMGLDPVTVRADIDRDDFYSLFSVRVGEAVYIEAKELTGWRVKRLKVSKIPLENADKTGQKEAGV